MRPVLLLKSKRQDTASSTVSPTSSSSFLTLTLRTNGEMEWGLVTPLDQIDKSSGAEEGSELLAEEEEALAVNKKKKK